MEICYSQGASWKFTVTSFRYFVSIELLKYEQGTKPFETLCNVH